MLLGAIASATAPAVTTDVLWEYKTRGPLTTTILGIVALDDGLALILFAVTSSFAAVILGANLLVSSAVAKAIYEIGMAVIVGLVFSLILVQILRRYAEKDKVLAFSLCSILFALGTALIMKVDMLLAAMTMGIVLINKEPPVEQGGFQSCLGVCPAFLYTLFCSGGSEV